MSSALVAAALTFYGASLVAQRDRQGRLMRVPGQNVLLPLTTGFGSNDELPRGPSLHCTTLTTGMRLASQPTSKAWMDSRFRRIAEWTVISERMELGDDVYAYNQILHPPPGFVRFTGLGGGDGGDVVLRGWCLVGRFGTWVE